MNTYPPSVAQDAANRAWRTFVQGLLLDLAGAAVAFLVVALTDVEWTLTYWQALGAALLKTLLTSAVSYAARKLAPPSV